MKDEIAEEWHRVPLEYSEVEIVDLVLFHWRRIQLVMTDNEPLIDLPHPLVPRGLPMDAQVVAT